MQGTAVDGCMTANGSSELGKIFFLQAVVGVKPEKTTPQFTARREFVILPMSWQQQQRKLDNEKNKKFDLGGWWGDVPHIKQRLYSYLLPGGTRFRVLICFVRLLFFVFQLLQLLLRREKNFVGKREDERDVPAQWMKSNFQL